MYSIGCISQQSGIWWYLMSSLTQPYICLFVHPKGCANEHNSNFPNVSPSLICYLHPHAVTLTHFPPSFPRVAIFLLPPLSFFSLSDGIRTGVCLCVMELLSGTPGSGVVCVCVWEKCGTMVGVGQALGLIVCGLVGPGTSHCTHNGAE